MVESQNSLIPGLASPVFLSPCSVSGFFTLLLPVTWALGLRPLGALSRQESLKASVKPGHHSAGRSRAGAGPDDAFLPLLVGPWPPASVSPAPSMSFSIQPVGREGWDDCLHVTERKLGLSGAEWEQNCLIVLLPQISEEGCSRPQEVA